MWRYNIGAVLVSLWLAGCATPKPDFQTQPMVKGEPLIYLYETKDNDRGACKIMYQGKYLVTLKPNSYFVHIPEPDEISYAIPRPDEVADEIDNGLTLGLVKEQKLFSTTFYAQAGKVYYFKVQGLYLAGVDETMALADLAKCHSVKGITSLQTQ
jgi:hypothetical protein